MRKVLIFLISFAFLSIASLGITVNDSAQAASPKVSIKNYKKDKNFNYPVINGKKYAQANKKMLNFTKQVYAADLKAQKNYKKDVKKGYTISVVSYYENISCKKVYQTSKKLSIVCIVYSYSGGAHGYSYAKIFNFLNGKQITLKKAFKSEKNYVAGKRYAKQYILNKPNTYIFADNKTTIASHPFYWTSKGLHVIFGEYEITSYSEGLVRRSF